MNAVHESDNHEIENCFLKIEKKVTIITMFDLKDGFQAVFALMQTCSSVNAYLRVFADTSFTTIYVVHRSVNPHPVIPIKGIVPIGETYYSDNSQNVVPIPLILFR